MHTIWKRTCDYAGDPFSENQFHFLPRLAGFAHGVYDRDIAIAVLEGCVKRAQGLAVCEGVDNVVLLQNVPLFPAEIVAGPPVLAGVGVRRVGHRNLGEAPERAVSPVREAREQAVGMFEVPAQRAFGRIDFPRQEVLSPGSPRLRLP